MRILLSNRHRLWINRLKIHLQLIYCWLAASRATFLFFCDKLTKQHNESCSPLHCYGIEINRWWVPFMLHLSFPCHIENKMHNRNTRSHPMKCGSNSLFFKLLNYLFFGLRYSVHDSGTEEDTTSHDLHCLKLKITKPNMFKCVWVVKQPFIAIFRSHKCMAEGVICADF